MIITAALDLPGNQVTHFYSTKKNTGEMIRMMDILIDRYAEHRKLYLCYHLHNGLNRVFGRYGAATLGLIVFIFHGV
jgi:hypothetical protein